MLNYLFSGSCRNCRAPIEPSAGLCRVCEVKRRCMRCRRYLDEWSFYDASSPICITCTHRHRSALGGSFNEVELDFIPTTTPSYQQFVADNQGSIDDIVQRAVEKHG